MKYTKKQLEKIARLKAYLNSDKKDDYLLIDSEWTNVYDVKNVYINASGLWVSGLDVDFNTTKDLIYPENFNSFFADCKKDNEFKQWLNKGVN